MHPLAKRTKRFILREWRLHALSVFSLAVAFVCLGATLLALTNLVQVRDRWARVGRVSVYLKDDVTQGEVETLRAALASVPHVTRVAYESREDARSRFASNETHEELARMREDAFPASLEVDVSDELSDKDLADVRTKLEALPSVESVETYERWAERIGRFFSGGVMVALGLALVVFAAVFAVVSSTIRLALQRRRTEIEVLRLVGATPGFVRGPFLLEGTLQGAVGAALSLALLFGLFLPLRAKLDGELSAVLGLSPSFLPWPVVLGMIAMGGILGLSASTLGIRKLIDV